jgi:peptide-methionine (S)-S-oxide reductase
MLRIFWENHNPTQGMQQGNDVGTQYRSGIYATTPAQLEAAERSREAFAAVLAEAGHPEITTEILTAPPFYYAEDYHQQYLAKVPNGYCGLGGTGLRLPVQFPEVERAGTG